MEELRELYVHLKSRMAEIDNTDLKFIGYHNWIEKEKIGKGLKRGSIYLLRKQLQEWIEPKGKVLISAEKISTEYSAELDRIRQFLKVSQLYLEEMVKDKFSNKTWLFYFLHFGGQHEGDPQLARTILRTKTNNRAEFQNLSVLEDVYSEDHFGTYTFLTDDVAFFDLKAKHSNKVLHIKTAFRSVEDEIMLGNYTSFDRQRVYSGTVVMQSIPEGLIAQKKLTPALLSHRNRPSEYGEVHYGIKSYLRLKSQNYNLVPKPIPTLNGLRDFTEAHPVISNTEKRFLEREKPLVFVATPQTAIIDDAKPEKSSVGRLIERINVVVEDNNCELLHLTDSYETLKVMEGMKALKATRFFIIIIDDITKASFSVLQLGWSLAFVKRVKVIYKEGTVSEKFQALDQLGVQMTSYTDLNEDFDNILSNVASFIITDMQD